MNANERKKIVKLIEPNILPNAVRIKVTVTEDENNVEETQVVEETVELIDELEVLDTVVDDDDDNEDNETDYDFSEYNKLQLIEILEETVQDTDVVKIKNKITAIKTAFTKITKEEREKEMEQFILDGGDKDSYEYNEDPLELRFKSVFNIYKEN